MPSSSTSTAPSPTTSRSCARLRGAVRRARSADDRRRSTTTSSRDTPRRRSSAAGWVSRATSSRRSSTSGSPATSRWRATVPRSDVTCERRCTTRRRACRSPSSRVPFAPRSRPRSREPASGPVSPPLSPQTTSRRASLIRRATSGRCRLLGPGLEPRDVLAFEDTEAGVASAKAAGLRCVGVLGTMGADRLRRGGRARRAHRRRAHAAPARDDLGDRASRRFVARAGEHAAGVRAGDRAGRGLRRVRRPRRERRRARRLPRPAPRRRAASRGGDRGPDAAASGSCAS